MNGRNHDLRRSFDRWILLYHRRLKDRREINCPPPLVEFIIRVVRNHSEWEILKGTGVFVEMRT